MTEKIKENRDKSQEEITSANTDTNKITLKSKVKFAAEVVLMIIIGFLTFYPLIIFGSNFLL
ncbi:MAG: hypothetical protein ACTSWX_10735 [Promethearchaeota archaeon]